MYPCFLSPKIVYWLWYVNWFSVLLWLWNLETAGILATSLFVVQLWWISIDSVRNFGHEIFANMLCVGVPSSILPGGFLLAKWMATSCVARGKARGEPSPPPQHAISKYRPGPVFVDVYGHLGIDSKNRFWMKNWFWHGHGTWAPRFQLIS